MLKLSRKRKRSKLARVWSHVYIVREKAISITERGRPEATTRPSLAMIYGWNFHPSDATSFRD